MKKWLRAALMAGAMLLLSGCIFKAPDDLYQLPQRSPGYEKLTARIAYVRNALELEYGAVVEPAVIYSGDNTSNIQMQDLDGDGEPETAVTFLRVPGAERPLRICLFNKLEDENYELSCMVEGEGAAIYAVDFEDLSGDGKKELVASWQASTNAYRLGVYSLDHAVYMEAEQADASSADGPEVHFPEATELMSTTYSGYSLLDMDQDTRMELAVVKIDSAGTNSRMELYGWADSGMSLLGTSRLSAGITALSDVRANFVADNIRALYISGTLMDASLTTDIVVWRKDRLMNLTMNVETGISSETIQGYNITPSDVNDDTILEMPRPHLLTSNTQDGSSNFWLIDWSQYDVKGKTKRIFTTYHNALDNWYLEIPDYWVDQITISRNDTVSGERAVVFSRWSGPEEEPTPFLVIYKLTGPSRTIRAAQAGRFVLSEDDSTIYAASLLDAKWNCGLDEAGVRDRFHRTTSDWSE